MVELQQDAQYVFEFMRRIEEQPKWHEGVKMCEIISKVANTTHVKQVRTVVITPGTHAVQLMVMDA